jgi:hypothetical protein
MRYNKIFAGPATETLPQVVEALVTSTYKPGVIVTLSAGKFALAGVATLTQLFVLQDNYLAMLGTDDAYQADETAPGMIPLDEQFFNCRFAASAAITKGDAIALAANGLLQKLPAAAGTYIVVGYADETVTLGAGGEDLIRVRFTQPRQVTVT